MGMGFILNVISTPPTTTMGYLFLVGSNIFLLTVVQQRVVILEFLQEKMSAHPSTLPSCDRIMVFHPKVDVYKGIPHTIH